MDNRAYYDLKNFEKVWARVLKSSHPAAPQPEKLMPRGKKPCCCNCGMRFIPPR